MNSLLKVTLFIACALILSCDKEPKESKIPSLKFVDISRANGTQTTGTSTTPIDQVIITTEFEDGDGNLGGNDDFFFIQANRLNAGCNDSIFILDTAGATSLTEGLSLEELNISESSIKGTITLERTFTGVESIDLLAKGDTVTFSIFLKDRDGNTSNTVTTSPPVVIQSGAVRTTGGNTCL
ncbi:MAG: hypothetical protein AB8B61_01810 [Cyclobacteriaceae bacterium]